MPLLHFADDEPVLDARARYFEANRFGPNGGYDDAWVVFDFGPFPIVIPNSKGRVRAVRFHDLHHLATGYDTDMFGEFEISAWELGAGCEDFHAAWIINLGGLTAGLTLAPIRTLRAFARGRRSKSLYRVPNLDELLAGDIASLRARTNEPAETRIEPGDVLRALGLGLVGASTWGAAFVPALVIGTPFAAYLNWKKRASEA